ncbi:MAG: glycogen/starch synthase [Spirochaetes bacterium]|nr:glycogen/starch synthase [Spirochaetota bacterium]
MENSIISSLCRFKLSDEHLISDTLVKSAISRAFDENRCFEFYVDGYVARQVRGGDPIEMYRERFFDLRTGMFDTIVGDDQMAKSRLMSDVRLSTRLVSAIVAIHRAVAEGDFDSIIGRRFVIVKELPGVPTLYHVSKETTVISHVGQGPPWSEIPTIYLGLKVFDALSVEQKKGQSLLFDAFRMLLMIEERAIQTGYTHVVVYPFETSMALNFLVDEVIRYSLEFEVEEVPPLEVPPERVRKFTANNRKTYMRELDARLKGDDYNFNYERAVKAVKTLERLARRYKQGGDEGSLREVMRLLVAASGHDIHEVRNRANIILERILAPKEFDAPLATRFINLIAGSSYEFDFELPDPEGEYFIRFYRNSSQRHYFLENEIDTEDLDLVRNPATGRFRASRLFGEYGHLDFVVHRRKQKKSEWINFTGSSGRVNVMPDVRGEIILEIFPDIHGHTKTYWRDESGHPGLLYNENGQVIRLGNFSDIAYHLESISERYHITSIYLLGVQKRGSNREDWAPEASSPSPFSPMSLIEVEPFLGGDEGFAALVKRAHSLGIRIIVDIIPHINRRSDHLPDELMVFTYDHEGALVPRASTDGRYGSWNDGKLLNYRKLEVWEWLVDSILTLIERFDIDGIRFDSAHAVPIMMKKNNFPFVYNNRRNHEEMVEGTIVVNDREDEHFVTTGYYDSACRDIIAVPIHYFIMLNIQRKLRQRGKDFFVYIAECFWGHERFLTRTGIIPYNSSLFKICENIIHGKTDVREIYHLYDNYFPTVLPQGTELLGILGNHDERRALNTFGHRGLRAAITLTSFMSNIIMDYEGSAEGEGWKVYLDNIYVNWNQFEYAAHRSLENVYEELYRFHREARGKGYLVWANNIMVAAAMKFTGQGIWLGCFNFADSNQNASIQFDNPGLPIPQEACYRISDPLFSPITGQYSYYLGEELRISRLNTVVSYTERVKLLRFEEVDIESYYGDFLRDSFVRLCEMSNVESIRSNFSFSEILKHCGTYKGIIGFIRNMLVPIFWEGMRSYLELGLKRAAFYLVKNGYLDGQTLIDYGRSMRKEKDQVLRDIGNALLFHNQRGSLVFMSAEADPFSKSGGLANVVYELPRELVKLGETVYVITGYYRNGDPKSMKRMGDAVKKYDVQYTGKNVSFKILDSDFQVGVHSAMVDGVKYFLLDHYEFFDGLYWGVTSEEKLRRRVAFARCCAEVIVQFGLDPHYTLTNDAYSGLFNGIVRCDPYYTDNPNFARTTFLHVIHNGGWQYFDAYQRFERGFDLFSLFNLPSWRGTEFCDPVHQDRINCMAAGIRFASRTVTVSPSYAQQIMYACDGLERILQNVIGISNAIGRDFKSKINERFVESGFVEEYYPALRTFIKNGKELRGKIESRYPEIIEGSAAIESVADPVRRYTLLRMRNKLMLQLQRGLKVDPDLVLCTFIHRISEQKGFQLLLESSEGVFKNLGFQAIIGGAVSSGDRRGEEIAQGLFNLKYYYQDMVDVSVGFQDVSIPLLCSDIFLMPSMHEPGGISQLEAFSAGALVVARATGGLRDTVQPIRVLGDEVKGNGFLFSDYSPWAFYDAMERAAHFFRESDDRTIHRARMNAERSIYFWDKPARQYVEAIYEMTETIRVLS